MISAKNTFEKQIGFDQMWSAKGPVEKAQDDKNAIVNNTEK